MKKNIVVSIITIVLVIFIIISFVFYTKSNSEQPTLQDKVSDEIKYLNSYLISLLGHFNGITLGTEIFQTSQPRTQLGKIKENNPQNEENGNNVLDEGQTGQESDNASQENSAEKGTSQDNNENKSNLTNLIQNGIFANQGNYDANWDVIRLTSRTIISSMEYY